MNAHSRAAAWANVLRVNNLIPSTRVHEVETHLRRAFEEHEQDDKARNIVRRLASIKAPSDIAALLSEAREWARENT